ncbi:hypothetical protein GCM10022237_24660 [Nocardioides ginsengisoli]|uniref:Tetracycline repressor TetR C-terminal domain-containing protein n=1 Tax=Nocardioides ginsengisoli TaxID=363868 RepID=A0ABW3W6U2_9ACTN
MLRSYRDLAVALPRTFELLALAPWARSRPDDAQPAPAAGSEIGHLRDLEMYDAGVEALIAGLAVTLADQAGAST